MIESLYKVRCEGGCGRYLASLGGDWVAVADMPELWTDSTEAEHAARAAGWIACNSPCDNRCYNVVCLDCRERR